MKRIAAVVGLALLIVIPVMALGGGGATTLNTTQLIGGEQIETPSDNWQVVKTFQLDGVIGVSTVVSLSGDAYAQDFGQGGDFKGEKYAAMKVKATADGNNLGVRTFADNRGVVGSQKPKPFLNTAKWITSESGTIQIKIWMKSVNRYDKVGFKDYDISLTYGQT